MLLTLTSVVNSAKQPLLSWIIYKKIPSKRPFLKSLKTLLSWSIVSMADYFNLEIVIEKS